MSGPEVIVVGAGPVGLAAALTLANAGVPVAVYERAHALTSHSRACTFHPAVLDLLADLGVAQPLIAKGTAVHQVQWRTRRGEVLAAVDMTLLKGLTGHPFRLHAEQSTLTGLLARQLARHPHASLHFGTAVDAVSDAGPGVRVRAGGTWASARYVVAADGARSTVRTLLGLPFPAVPYPTQALRIMTGTPLTDYLPDLAPLTYVRDRDISCSLLQLPDHWRIVIRLPISDTVPSRNTVTALARRALPPTGRGPRILDTHTYRLARAVLPSFRRGRVLFAGDAAHLTSTAGGLNMNAGILDAVEVGRVLAAVLGEGASTAALEGWATRRRKIILDKVIPRSEARVAGVQDLADAHNVDRHRREAAMTHVHAIAADPAATRGWLAEASLLDTTLPSPLLTR
ncbi:FAD-dependent oxidoreductase [Nonomuraea sp. NPDC003707]